MSQPPNTDQAIVHRPNNFPPPGARTWTPPLIERFHALLAQRPLLRYAEIAETLSDEFGIRLTKNACIGFGRRNGVPRRQPEWRKPKQSPRPRAPYVAKKRLLPRPPKSAPGRKIGKLDLLELEPHECRWPFGDGPYLFCGKPKLAGSSYCLGHTRISSPSFMRRS